MSFSQNVKKEILARELDGDCCAAAAYGFACFGKLFGAQGAVFYTELPAWRDMPKRCLRARV